ncbi:MAG: phytanoyl-CoA dioxygenase family protein [Brasilonema angustatum HA4187-MV1]|jgi:ectoine hydroxylase-related dioxygenase (phytanoyl-CoA dioxygenase family)|nr:phytanoyl-CoA dioxygenase family protein [Brasilonema angustatum HA4187-MV1]
MSSAKIPKITNQEIEAFEQDGVVCLRGLFEDVWLERLRSAVDWNMTNPGPIATNLTQGGRLHLDVFMWTRNSDFRAFVFESPVAAIAAQILKAEKVHFLFDHLLVKEPGYIKPILWHNDHPDWPLQGWNMCSLWVALDPVTKETGGVQYIKGSHQWRKWLRQKDALAEAVAHSASLELLSWNMAPGDCLVHHALTIHASSGNASTSTRRRALVTRWAGDGVTYDPRPDTFITHINKIGVKEVNSIHRLHAGDSIDCDLFPQLWPRA